MSRRSTTRRGLHPLAWWGWAVAMCAAAIRTTNPLLLVLILAVVAYVVAARRTDAPWARSFGVFLKLGIFVVVIRLVLEMLFGRRLPGTEVFTLPSVELPEWAAGVSLGGPVTVELILGALTQGLRLAVLLAFFGAANSLASPSRLLRSLPAVLYEAGVIVTVALSFGPQLVLSIGRTREARRFRGRATRGVAGVRGIAMPVLEGALDRSIALAASMDGRGYGRKADLAVSTRRVATGATGLGLLALCLGVYAMLGGGGPSALGLPVVGLGAVALSAGLAARGRRTPRTRYRPDPWGRPEWVVLASGLAALAGVVVTARTDPGALTMPLYPLAWPALPAAAVAGILAGLLPAVVAPRPAGPFVPAPSPARSASPVPRPSGRAPHPARPPVAATTRSVAETAP
jgi:energy-coupling factor transport system permease protein